MMSLSDRETDVIKLVARGLSNKEIAKVLVISRHTVKVHLHNIFKKLGAQSRTQAAIMYLKKEGLTCSV
jgi:DNA-binding NarL/FixJ family response regulator